jgi:hypothetical protein
VRSRTREVPATMARNTRMAPLAPPTCGEADGGGGGSSLAAAGFGGGGGARTVEILGKREKW